MEYLLYKVDSLKTFVLGHQTLIMNINTSFRQGRSILYPMEYLFTQKQKASLWKEGSYLEFLEYFLMFWIKKNINSSRGKKKSLKLLEPLKSQKVTFTNFHKSYCFRIQLYSLISEEHTPSEEEQWLQQHWPIWYLLFRNKINILSSCGKLLSNFVLQIRFIIKICKNQQQR